MSDRQRSPEEQAFLAETGLHPDDPAHLVDDAPPLPAETLARIRNRAREKAGLAAAPAQALPSPHSPASQARFLPSPDSQASPVPSPPSAKSPAPTRRTRRWLAAAAAALILVGGTVFLSDPGGALAAIQRLVRLVPGIGLRETDGETWVITEPVSVQLGDVRVTVIGFISSPEETYLRLRTEWPPSPAMVKARSLPDSASPELRLPDGTVMRSRQGFTSGGSREMSGKYAYGPLPPGTRDVVVVIPHLSGGSASVEIPLTLVNAAEAGLAEAYPGSWSEERHGVRVGVPHWTAAGDRIVLALDARLPKGVVVHEYGDDFGLDHKGQPMLTDDQGRTYPLISAESDLIGTPGRAVFRGPLAPDARRLTLTVPYLRLVDDSARARLTVPLEQLPEGQPLVLNFQLEIGGHRFTVKTVTRVDPDTFEFTLDLGPEEDGVLLQDLGIYRPVSLFGDGPGSGYGEGVDGQMTLIGVDFRKPPRGNLEITFAEPTYRVNGGWEVHLPVPASPSPQGNP
ncbi:hypothetical protein J2Z79_003029 [Symbiobacterium terraclitae]|uniref:DUF4179 domain-containing protein n=1 Tax=Symbiobacterium terraclitae TaxID=557451 RepID=A0ABS4JVK6_9FIRM|nr:hypothetical protein [Symbiobacterium terraclitae]MBP2019587.1 hypothetical protein [Symbiobacterium terraclitae]